MLITTCLGVGGAERVVIDLADSFCAQGHRVLVVSLKDPNTLVPRHPHTRTVCLKAGSFFDSLHILAQLRIAILDFKPDVVHAHLFHAILLARLIRVAVRFPVLISTFHSTRVGSLLRRWAYRITSTLSDQNTAVSREVADQFVASKAVDPRPICVIPNGIHPFLFQPREESRAELATELRIPLDTCIIVAVGRLEPPKDYPNLLRALELLTACGQPFAAVIVGEGSLRDDLYRLTTELGLKSRVHFLGLRSDIPNLLSAADIFVLPSEWEGLPRVVGEAMACQAAIVATDSGGVRELTAGTAILVPPRDSYALQQALYKVLLMSRAERKEMGLLARERIIEHFSLESVSNQWLSLYGKLISSTAN